MTEEEIIAEINDIKARIIKYKQAVSLIREAALSDYSPVLPPKTIRDSLDSCLVIWRTKLAELRGEE